MIAAVGGAQSVPRLHRHQDLRPVLAVAAGVVAFHLVLSGRYGFHRDELYHIAGGRHPALGYVDHPPLVPLLARLVTDALGPHLWPLRALAGAVHGVVVVVTALLAGDLGGGRRAMLLAALAAATMPLLVASGSLFSTVVFDQLWWALVLLLVVRLLGGADQRWWLAVGAVAGLGLETRWAMALLVAGLGVGLAAVADGRAQLRSPWLWAGGAVALVLWLPNLVWQALNGWPTLALVRDDDAGLRAAGGRLGYVLVQVGLVGPLAVPLVVAGLWWLWARRPWRVLAVAGATIAALLLAVGGGAHDLGPVYLVGIAAGSVATEGWLAAAPHRWHRAVGALAANALVPLAALAPVASVPVYAELFQDVNGELAEQVGWPEMVDLVAGVTGVLPDDEQADVHVLTASYGEAAAIDLYGPARGLPPGTALSAHNSYADWWPDGEPSGSFITLRYPRSALAPYCDTVGPLAVVGNLDGIENEIAGAPIHLCRGLRVSPDELREGLRRLE
jgi:4-amino-4-deoxy-L-arabinose transferase-like glycosyltransferase